MLMSTRTIAALRCSKCGKMDLYSISRFSCGKNGQLKIFCECGHCLMMLVRKGRNFYRLQVDCLMCDSMHDYKLPGKTIWNMQIYPLICNNMGLEFGYLGSKEEIIRIIQQEERSVRELINELDYEQYFLNPEVMKRAKEIIRDLLENGKVLCGCGTRQLETDFLSDRIEVYCPYCHAVGIIFTETPSDLRKLEGLQGIELEANSCRNLVDKRLKRKSKVKNKNNEDVF